MGLLRGLCVTLRVRGGSIASHPPICCVTATLAFPRVTVPVLELLASRAKIALALTIPTRHNAVAIAPPPERLPTATPLHARLCALLASLCDTGQLRAGVQA